MKTLLHGDCLDKLKELEESSVDSLITDPPAGISFMNKAWDDDKGGKKQWKAWMQDIAMECYRVLKPGAHGLVWAIPRTSHWTADAFEDAGFEVRDVVTHVFGSGFPKSLDISKAIDKMHGADREVVGSKIGLPGYSASKEKDESGYEGGWRNPIKECNITTPSTEDAKKWQGWGTALKPASEHWILIRKPLSEKTVAANVLKYGTGGLNIDASRITGEYKNQGGGSFATGKFKNSNVSNTDKDGLLKIDGDSSQGRFPANLVLSHNDDCEYVENYNCTEGCAVKLLDEQSLAQGVHGSGKARYEYIMPGQHNKVTSIFNGMAEKPRLTSRYGDAGGASRFFYCAKASKADKNEGLEGFTPKKVKDGRKTEIDNPFQRGETERLNTHPTVKNTKLMEYLIKLITPEGGVVLDPFVGSGSTGVAAIRNGFQFVGIEKEIEYFEIAQQRILSIG